MARKARQRISYVLPLANSPGGHRLGVNSLAIDNDQSILYSAGRDGVICAWDLNFGQEGKTAVSDNPFDSSEDSDTEPKPKSKPITSTFRSQVQAHTHWVNDIILTQSKAALVSASSDITVKVWRPHAEDGQSATTIGLHSDYVKCLASPGPHADWVASGGLDHKIRVWDLNGGGERLQLDAGEEENSAKGSVYALSVRGSVMASGGPEGIVRLWDPKSGKRITKFLGHTDNVRDILISQGGDMIMTASSDQTIKVWSMSAGRCMHTLTMHNDSVWSLYSDHPQLSIFYSSDRSGVVAKTDVRGSLDMDLGQSIAILQEHEGVNKIIVANKNIWTATSSSSINRWDDVETEAALHAPDSPRQQRISSIASRPRIPSPSESKDGTVASGENGKNIPPSCILRISNTAPLSLSTLRDLEASVPTITPGLRKQSEAINDFNVEPTVPIHNLPLETIEGQNGLIKHVMLNDRKRVLTLDTAGEVMLWDLLQGIPIKSFGKRHLEDVTPEVNTMESVANWCGVDTRTGRLTVILEENYCFDAETYADELDVEEPGQPREDHRINLGRWILRYLFAKLVDQEIIRDEIYRANLAGNNQQKKAIGRPNAPLNVQFHTAKVNGWQYDEDDSESAITPRPPNGHIHPAVTPGLSIGVATPGILPLHPTPSTTAHLPSTVEESNTLEKRKSHSSNPRTSVDYFSSTSIAPQPPQINGKIPVTPSEEHTELSPQSPVEPDKDFKSSSLFGKKFRMNMSLSKKLGRTSLDTKPVVVDDKSGESDKSSEKEDKIVEDNFYGIIQKIRNKYDEQLLNKPDEAVAPGINPSLPDESPLLRPPPLTTVIIQEDRPDSGGVADLYRGTVSSVGEDVDLIEKVAPMWLGDLLLRNQIPFKDPVKVPFVLLPFQDLLPSIASADGNSRLNANRMLRAKKILAYVAERIEAPSEDSQADSLKPEDYLDLYCQNQIVPHDMTLATLRAHMWKTGGDVILYYRSNGRKPELEKLVMQKAALAAEGLATDMATVHA